MPARSHKSQTNRALLSVALFLSGCISPGAGTHQVPASHLKDSPENILGVHSVGDVACHGWETINGALRVEVPLAIRNEGEQRYIVGSSSRNLVRFIVGVEEGHVFLALRHVPSDVGVSHAFKPSDSSIALNLTSAADHRQGSDLFELACLMKSEIP